MGFPERRIARRAICHRAARSLSSGGAWRRSRVTRRDLVRTTTRQPAHDSVPSQAALRRHEALHRACQHEEVRLTIRCMVLNDFFRRDRSPLVIKPSIPSVFRILLVTAFNLELCLYNIPCSAAGARSMTAIRMLVVVRALKALKPFLVRPVGPLSSSKARHRKNKRYSCGQQGRTQSFPQGPGKTCCGRFIGHSRSPVHPMTSTRRFCRPERSAQRNCNFTPRV
jgi:hypothetical protein